MHPQALAESRDGRSKGKGVGRPRLNRVDGAVAAINEVAAAPGTHSVPPVIIAVCLHPVE